MSRTRRSAVRRATQVAAVVLSLAACTTGPAAVETASGPPLANVPASPIAPSRQSQVPASPSPSGPTASGALTSPEPPSELEMLLPDFAGAAYLEKRRITPEELTGSGSNAIQARIFTRLLASLDRRPTDLEGAVANGPISMVAMRIDGVSGTDFADAYATATLAEAPSGTLTTATAGERPVRRIQWTDRTFPSDLTLLVVDDVLIVVGATPDKQSLVDDVLVAMFEPKLDAVLPAELLGRSTTRFSFPAGSVSASGDMCMVVCPGEPQKLAAQLGVTVDTMDIAVSILDKQPSVMIVAMRVPGATDARLIDARIAQVDRTSDPAFARTATTIAGKPVTWVRYGPFPSPDQRELLYAHDGILFIVHPAPDAPTDPPSAEVAAAFAALP